MPIFTSYGVIDPSLRDLQSEVGLGPSLSDSQCGQIGPTLQRTRTGCFERLRNSISAEIACHIKVGGRDKASHQQLELVLGLDEPESRLLNSSLKLERCDLRSTEFDGGEITGPNAGLIYVDDPLQRFKVFFRKLE